MRAAVLVLFLLLGCSSLSVKRDTDPEADFASFEKFAWYPSSRSGTRDPQLDRRIRAAVEQVLTARGYRISQRGRPHFFVAYHLSLDERLDARTLNGEYGWARYPGRSPVALETRSRVFEKGTLVIDVSDALREQLVWRGWAPGRLRGYTPEQLNRRVDAVVAQILGRFPAR